MVSADPERTFMLLAVALELWQNGLSGGWSDRSNPWHHSPLGSSRLGHEFQNDHKAFE